MVQVISGHNYANRHQFIIDNKKYPHEEPDDLIREAAKCPLCGEGEESTYHILVECEALQPARERYLGPQVETPYLALRSSSLAMFLRNAVGSLNFFQEVDHTEN